MIPLTADLNEWTARHCIHNFKNLKTTVIGFGKNNKDETSYRTFSLVLQCHSIEISSDVLSLQMCYLNLTPYTDVFLRIRVIDQHEPNASYCSALLGCQGYNIYTDGDTRTCQLLFNTTIMVANDRWTVNILKHWHHVTWDIFLLHHSDIQGFRYFWCTGNTTYGLYSRTDIE